MTIGCLSKFSMCESDKIRQWALYACSTAVAAWVVSALNQPVWVAHGVGEQPEIGFITPDTNT